MLGIRTLVIINVCFPTNCMRFSRLFWIEKFLLEGRDFIDIEIGDGENTIFMKGMNIYRLQIESVDWEHKYVPLIMLKTKDFPASYEKEFLKNWQSDKFWKIPN